MSLLSSSLAVLEHKSVYSMGFPVTVVVKWSGVFFVCVLVLGERGLEWHTGFCLACSLHSWCPFHRSSDEFSPDGGTVEAPALQLPPPFLSGGLGVRLEESGVNTNIK